MNDQCLERMNKKVRFRNILNLVMSESLVDRPFVARLVYPRGHLFYAVGGQVH